MIGELLVDDEERLIEALAYRHRDKKSKVQCVVDVFPHRAAESRSSILAYLRMFEQRPDVQNRLAQVKRDVMEETVLSITEAQYKLSEWVMDIDDRMLHCMRAQDREAPALYVRWISRRDNQGNEIGRTRAYCVDDARTLDELPDSVARYVRDAIWVEDEQCYVLKLDEDLAMKDRLKALELLMKFKGDYADRLELTAPTDDDEKQIRKDMTALEASAVYRDMVKGG